MTGREHLNRRKRWLTGAVVTGLGLIAAGIGLVPALAGEGVGGPAIAAVVVPGVVLLLVAVVAGQQYLFRCPWCRENLGPLVMHGGWWRVNRKLRFCPYCGAELDADADAPAGTDPWDEPVE
jgi:hypothetical protein